MTRIVLEYHGLKDNEKTYLKIIDKQSELIENQQFEINLKDEMIKNMDEQIKTLEKLRRADRWRRITGYAKVGVVSFVAGVTLVILLNK